MEEWFLTDSPGFGSGKSSVEFRMDGHKQAFGPRKVRLHWITIYVDKLANQTSTGALPYCIGDGTQAYGTHVNVDISINGQPLSTGNLNRSDSRTGFPVLLSNTTTGATAPMPVVFQTSQTVLMEGEFGVQQANSVKVKFSCSDGTLLNYASFSAFLSVCE